MGTRSGWVETEDALSTWSYALGKAKEWHARQVSLLNNSSGVRAVELCTALASTVDPLVLASQLLFLHQVVLNDGQFEAKSTGVDCFAEQIRRTHTAGGGHPVLDGSAGGRHPVFDSFAEQIRRTHTAGGGHPVLDGSAGGGHPVLDGSAASQTSSLPNSFPSTSCSGTAQRPVAQRVILPRCNRRGLRSFHAGVRCHDGDEDMVGGGFRKKSTCRLVRFHRASSRVADSGHAAGHPARYALVGPSLAEIRGDLFARNGAQLVGAPTPSRNGGQLAQPTLQLCDRSASAKNSDTQSLDNDVVDEHQATPDKPSFGCSGHANVNSSVAAGTCDAEVAADDFSENDEHEVLLLDGLPLRSENQPVNNFGPCVDALQRLLGADEGHAVAEEDEQLLDAIDPFSMDVCVEALSYMREVDKCNDCEATWVATGAELVENVLTRCRLIVSSGALSSASQSTCASGGGSGDCVNRTASSSSSAALTITSETGPFNILTIPSASKGFRVIRREGEIGVGFDPNVVDQAARIINDGADAGTRTCCLTTSSDANDEHEDGGYLRSGKSNGNPGPIEAQRAISGSFRCEGSSESLGSMSIRDPQHFVLYAESEEDDLSMATVTEHFTIGDVEEAPT